MGGGGHAGAEKSEVLHFSKWHWQLTGLGPLHLDAGFLSTVSSAEWELPAFSSRGGFKGPERNALSR